jgi:histone H3/H4
MENKYDTVYRPGEVESMLLRRPCIKRLGNSVQVSRISKKAYNELIAEYVRFIDYFLGDILQSMTDNERSTMRRRDVEIALENKNMNSYLDYIQNDENFWDNIPHLIPFTSFRTWFKFRAKEKHAFDLRDGIQLYERPVRISLDATRAVYTLVQRRLQVVIRRGKLLYQSAKKRTLTRSVVRRASKICNERTDILDDHSIDPEVPIPYNPPEPRYNHIQNIYHRLAEIDEEGQIGYHIT